MTHARQQLREAVVGLLLAVPQTGGRVRSGRAYPWQDAELPCLEVLTAEEALAEDSLSGEIQQRECALDVVIRARATAGVDDLLDAIAEQVEAALGSAVAVGAVSVDLRYEGASSEFSDAAQEPTGRATLRYTATYFVAAGVPGTLR